MMGKTYQQMNHLHFSVRWIITFPFYVTEICIWTNFMSLKLFRYFILYWLLTVNILRIFSIYDSSICNMIDLSIKMSKIYWFVNNNLESCFSDTARSLPISAALATMIQFLTVKHKLWFQTKGNCMNESLSLYNVFKINIYNT